jgi:hypothetical protein
MSIPKISIFIYMSVYKIKNYHYYNRYIKFINHYKSNPIDETKYFEEHHILPKSMGGSDISDNLINLTARGHFLAHYLLWKSFRNRQTAYAFNCMNVFLNTKNNKKRRYFNSRLFEKFVTTSKEFFVGKNHPLYGKSKSEETIQKQRLKILGKKQSIEHITKRKESLISYYKNNPNIKRGFSGRKHSDETKIRMSQTHSGVKKTKQHVEKMKLRPQNNLNTECIYCHKTGEYKNMKRWHFDFCKENPNKKQRKLELISCYKCGFSSKKTPNFFKNHQDNCKSIPK